MKQIFDIQRLGARALLLAVMVFAGQNVWGQTEPVTYTFDGNAETYSLGEHCEATTYTMDENETFAVNYTDAGETMQVMLAQNNNIYFEYKNSSTKKPVIKTGENYIVCDSKNFVINVPAFPGDVVYVKYSAKGSTAAALDLDSSSSNPAESADEDAVKTCSSKTEAVIFKVTATSEGTFKIKETSGGMRVYAISINQSPSDTGDPAAPGDEEYGKGGSAGVPFGEDMTKEEIAEYVGATMDVQLKRTFYKDGGSNTICLPFSLSAEQLAASPLKGYAKLQEFSSASVADKGTDRQSLELTMTDATAIEAGKPYVISWAGGDNIVDPVFEGVTVTADEAAQTKSSNGVSFCGSFTQKAVSANDKGIMFIDADGQLSWPNENDSIKGFRCYFKISND